MSQDSMTSSKSEIKQITVRWPEDFWEKASIEATKRRTSLQEIVTLAVAKYLKIEPPTTKDADAA